MSYINPPDNFFDHYCYAWDGMLVTKSMPEAEFCECDFPPFDPDFSPILPAEGC